MIGDSICIFAEPLGQFLPALSSSLRDLIEAARGECPAAIEVLYTLPQGATVVHVGHTGWDLPHSARKRGLAFIGVVPPGSETRAATSCRRLDLPNDYCDYLVAVRAIERFPDGDALFAELLRVVKPGGLMYIDTSNVWNWDQAIPPTVVRWGDTAFDRPYGVGGLGQMAALVEATAIARSEHVGGERTARMLVMKSRLPPRRPKSSGER